jgi:hypothetical protein
MRPAGRQQILNQFQHFLSTSKGQLYVNLMYQLQSISTYYTGREE